MRKKRIMIMGGSGSGKTTLAAFLEPEAFPIRKTPHMVYRSCTLEAPGAYLECPWMHHHLIAAAQDASCVLMLADASVAGGCIYPPGFARAFRVPVFGIITKYGRYSERISAAEAQLRQTGIRESFYYLDFDGHADSEIRQQELKQILEPYRMLALDWNVSDLW